MFKITIISYQFSEVELALVRSSVTSKNCRRTSNFPNLLVRRTSGIFSAIDTYLFKFGGKREKCFHERYLGAENRSFNKAAGTRS